MGFGKAIAIIGGVAAGAVGAYNYSTTGCPLGTGSCDSGESAAIVSTASQTEGDACPLGCEMDANTDAATLMVSGETVSANSESCCSAEGDAVAAAAEAESCCSSMSKAAAVMAVAETTEEASSCCSAESAAVAEKADDCCGQCGDDNAECDPAECTAGDACCQAVASKDD